MNLNDILGGSSQQSSSNQNIYGPQNTIFGGSYYPYLTNLFNQYQNNPQSLVAGFTPAQQTAQNYAENYAGQLPQQFQNAQNMQGALASPTSYQQYSNALAPASSFGLLNAMQQPSGQYGDALSQMMSGNVNYQPYNQMASDITNQMAQNFNQNIIPSIRRNSLQASGIPTSRMSIPTQQAANQFEQNLGSTLNQLYLPAYQQAQTAMGTGAGLYGDAMNRAMQASATGLSNLGQSSQLGSSNLSSALNFSPQLANLGLSPYQLLNDVGGQQQALNQQYLSSPFTFGQTMQGLIGQPTVLGSSQSSGSANRGLTQGFNDVFGGAGSMIMSDRRLKKAIKQIGKYKDYIVYEFEYLWSPQKYIGVMAQDVMKINPKAVIPVGDYFAVDYGAL